MSTNVTDAPRVIAVSSEKSVEIQSDWSWVRPRDDGSTEFLGSVVVDTPWGQAQTPDARAVPCVIQYLLQKYAESLVGRIAQVDDVAYMDAVRAQIRRMRLISHDWNVVGNALYVTIVAEQWPAHARSFGWT